MSAADVAREAWREIDGDRVAAEVALDAFKAEHRTTLDQQEALVRRAQLLRAASQQMEAVVRDFESNEKWYLDQEVSS